MAIITVIRKKTKDPLKCSPFQPISLLNMDYKLISKALPNRLSTFLPQLMNPDQGGFIQQSSSSNNFCRLLNIIHTVISGNDLGVVFTLD